MTRMCGRTTSAFTASSRSWLGAIPLSSFCTGTGWALSWWASSAPEAAKELCALSDPATIEALRERFSRLGALWETTTREALGTAASNERLAEERRNGAEKLAALAGSNQRAAEAATQLHDQAERLRALDQSLAEQRETSAKAVAELNAARRVGERAQARLDEQRETIAELNAVIASLSTSPGQTIERQAFEHHDGLQANFEAAFHDPGRRMGRRFRKHALKFLGPLGKRKREQLRQADVVRRSIFFDRNWYVQRNPSLESGNKDPALHYVRYGAKEGQDPGPLFSARRYLELNPDVAEAGLNPLVHYLQVGKAEGRQYRSNQVVLPDARPRPQNIAPTGQRSFIYLSGEPTTPGHIYRVAQYIEAAAANGVAADWLTEADLPSRLRELLRYDVLVIWRAPWSENIERAVALMRAAGKLIVFDCDDLMTEPDLAVTKIIDGIRTQHLTEESVREHYGRVRATMLAADICFASTQELAFHTRWCSKVTHVLPNGFSQSTHDVSRQAARSWGHHRDGLIRIGYAGGSRTHQKDLGLASRRSAASFASIPNVGSYCSGPATASCRSSMSRSSPRSRASQIRSNGARSSPFRICRWRWLASTSTLLHSRSAILSARRKAS